MSIFFPYSEILETRATFFSAVLIGYWLWFSGITGCLQLTGQNSVSAEQRVAPRATVCV